MKAVLQRLSLVLAAAGVAAFALPALAQAPGESRGQPYIGQPGKDVVWVPTPDAVVSRMLDMARLTPGDYLVDLGSGDGRTVIAAAKRGVRAMGVEYNPDMVALSRREAARYGVQHLATFVQGDIFATDFREATVVTMYLLPSLNLKLRPQLLDMKPGTRLVSHAFNMGDWEPDETATPEGRQVFLWVVPAKVEGTWLVRFRGQSRELSLRQAFQKIQGTLRGSAAAPLLDARLRGSEIAFAVVEGNVRYQFAGSVDGDRMSGTLRIPGEADAAWSAQRR